MNQTERTEIGELKTLVVGLVKKVDQLQRGQIEIKHRELSNDLLSERRAAKLLKKDTRNAKPILDEAPEIKTVHLTPKGHKRYHSQEVLALKKRIERR